MPRQPDLTIRHDMPGRLRLRIPGLSANGEYAGRIKNLKSVDGVVWTRVNPKCASLVLGYDPEEVSRGALLDHVRRSFTPAPDAGGAAAPVKRDNVGKSLRRFAAISAVLGVSAARSALTGVAASQAALSPLGLAAFAFGFPLIRKGLRKLREKKVSLDAFLAGGIMAATVAGEAMTAFEILWINAGAEVLSELIAERSRKSIEEILEITSHHTFVLRDGVEVEMAVEDVSPGEVVVLHTGEKVSVDGFITEGEALVNEAPLTGREELVLRSPGDEVHAGTFVHQGVIMVRAERVGDETYLARVMDKVRDSLENRAPIEGVADNLASSLIKIGFATTAGTWLLTGSAWRAFTVLLVMACPCATVLAASTAVSAAINAAARNHILVKGGRYLEEAGKCDTACFDKTGTLTTTEPMLARLVPGPDAGEMELISTALAAEVHNHHPLAQALKAEAARRGITARPHSVCEYHLGMGMWAKVNGREIHVGNAKLADIYALPLAPLAEEAEKLKSEGLTVLRVYRDKKLMGLMGFESRIRPESEGAVKRLKAMGVKRFLLVTGDEEASTRRLGEALGIDEFHCSALPEDKARLIEELERSGAKVLMIGDGINDALALAKAHVGVAMGAGGSEVAVEAADIALASDDLAAVPEIYDLSQRTLRVAHQNFWIATGSNLAGVVLGAAGLLSPVMAGLVHIGHSLGVVANSSRLLAHFRNAPIKTHEHDGDGHGLQHPGRAARLPLGQAPHPGQNPDQVRSGDHQGQGGPEAGQDRKGTAARS